MPIIYALVPVIHKLRLMGMFYAQEKETSTYNNQETSDAQDMVKSLFVSRRTACRGWHKTARNYLRDNCGLQQWGFSGMSEWSRRVVYAHSPKRCQGNSFPIYQSDFSLPCSQSFESVIGEPPRREFHLIRDPRNDQLLEEFITLREKDMTTSRVREVHRTVWKRLPGMEQEKLPFGQIVQSYQDPALPLLPIL